MSLYHNCPICYQSVRHPQQVTCGGADCRDGWKHLNSAARLKKQNLASLSPSERAYCLAVGPTPDELEAQEQMQAQLNAEVLEYHAAEQKKQTPAFIRDMFNPDNLKSLVKDKEDTDEKNELPNASKTTP